MSQPTKSLSLVAASSQAFYTADNVNLASDFTIEFWVKFNSDPDTVAQYLLDKWTGGGGNNRDWVMYFAGDGTIRLQNTSDGTAGTALSDNITTGGLDTATWYHPVFTYDISTGLFKFYLAEEGGSHTLISTSSALNTTIHNGTTRHDWFSTGASQFTDGLIHDFRIWSAVRSISEMDDNFENADMTDSETDLIMRLRFEDDLTDSSPSSDHATAIGSPAYSTTIPVWAAAGPTQNSNFLMHM